MAHSPIGSLEKVPEYQFQWPMFRRQAANK